MWILKKLFEMLARFFGTKAGKTTAKAMMGVGVAAGGAAGAEMIVAHKRNERAERIKESALKRHDKGRIKVEKTLADLGETKLEIYKSFGVLADAVESIQQRPDYDFFVDGIELPEFNPAEFKKIAIAVEVAAGGFGGVVAGGAVGAAAMGTGTILALAPGALLGGVVLCAMGAKMLHRSAEKVKTAKKIAEDVDTILVYYSELDKTAKRFHETFKKVQAPYMQHVHKVQKIVARKTDWENFSKAERLALKNAVALAQLLHRMCSVQLVLEATKKDTLESVNTPVVDRMISDANNVFEQVKKGLCA